MSHRLPEPAKRKLRMALLAILSVIGLQQLGSAALIHAKAALAPHLMHYAWEASLADGGRPHKPWPWADTWPVARLTVPALGVDQFVLAGATGNALAFGPGLDGAGAMPGDEGTAIIAGHRDTHFGFLKELKPAMTFDIQLADGRQLRYRAGVSAIIDSSDPMERPSLSGPARLELVTCYPFDAVVPGGPLRYIVSAEPLPAAQPEWPSEVLSSGEALPQLAVSLSSQGEIAL